MYSMNSKATKRNRGNSSKKEYPIFHQPSKKPTFSFAKDPKANEAREILQRSSLQTVHETLPRASSSIAAKPLIQSAKPLIQSAKPVIQNNSNMFKTANGGEVSHEKFVPPLLQPKAIVIPQQKPQDCGNFTTKSTEDPEKSKKDISPLLADINPELGEEILRTIVSGTETSLDDIVGNSIAKDALEWAVVFPNMNPDIFTGLLQPDRGILLFGPPGNGKTMLAKAVASVSKYTFFNISAATIMSKWVGEAEKMIQALFQMAKNGQPSIIFVDELDSMLCERNESEGGCSRRVKTEFLLQFDGCMSKQTDRILVLGATNRPHELDDGILRRFPKRIFIDLPDVNTREALLQKTFAKGGRSLRLAIEPEEWRSFAESLEGYSHSDIVALCREAAFLPLRDMSRDRLTSGLKQHELRPITIADLKTASSVIRPCTNQEHLKRMRDFAEKFAQTF